jgi:hypothetical protein
MRGEKTKGEKLLDIGLGWLVRYEFEDYWLDFEAFEVIGEQVVVLGHPEDPTNGKKLFRRKGATGGYDDTADPDDAEATTSGFVKWDGCSEMTLGTPHFCGRSDLANFAAVLVAIHDLARDTIPNFSREIGA